MKFVRFKQSIFKPNKNVFKSNKILPQIKQIVSLTIYQCINFFVLKKNLFDLNKYLFGLLNKLFSFIQSNLFSLYVKRFESRSIQIG